MIRCKKNGITRNANSILINKAWLAAVTACSTEEYSVSDPLPPKVTNLALEIDDHEVFITWTPHQSYQTEVQTKVDDGEWTTLSLIHTNIGEV